MGVVDVELDQNGDIGAITRHITGIPLVLQRVKIRLQTFLGEWILDQTVGLPFLAFAEQKPPDVNGISAVVQATIVSVPGVNRIRSFTGGFNNLTRQLVFDGQIVLDDEQVVETAIVLFPGLGNSTPAVIMFTQSGSINFASIAG